MIKCNVLNKEFATKDEMFAELRKSKKQLIDFKTSQIYKSCEKDNSIYARPIDVSKYSETNKGIQGDENFYYVAVNSTGILDSHGDLHVKGIWNKSIKEQQGKNYLVLDHKMEVANTVVKKEYIKTFAMELPFNVVGKNYEGNGEFLIYKFPKDKVINSIAKEWLESGDAIESSVRMQYVKVNLAMNSTNKEDSEEKATYDNNIDLVANKSDFEEIDYFFVVKEAANRGESSLVLAGSNHVTGVIEIEEKQEPLKSTIDNEPSEDTQPKTRRKSII